MKITVKSPSHSDISLECEEITTVLELKQKILEKEKEFTTQRQRILFCGKILRDEQTLKSAKISDGCAVSLFLRQQDFVEPKEPTFVSPLNFFFNFSRRWQ